MSAIKLDSKMLFRNLFFVLLQRTTTPIASNNKLFRLTSYCYFSIYLLNKLKTYIWNIIDTMTNESNWSCESHSEWRDLYCQSLSENRVWIVFWTSPKSATRCKSILYMILLNLLHFLSYMMKDDLGKMVLHHKPAINEILRGLKFLSLT